MKLDDHPQYKKEEVEQVDELYKGKHGQSDKEYADSRSQGGKMVSGDSKSLVPNTLMVAESKQQTLECNLM